MSITNPPNPNPTTILNPPTSTSTVKLRKATFTDLPEISHLLTRAFWNEACLGQFIHPNREQYPDDFRQWWLRKFQKDFFDWAFVFLVTTDVDGKISGVAKWHRQGEGVGLRRRGWGLGWWDLRNLLAPTVKVYTNISSYFYPNRASVPGRENVLEQSMPFCEHFWTGDRAETWYLDLLGVHPDYQGQGIGRVLVEWGIRKAEEEGVCASVIAAPNKDRFYQACGFETRVGSACAGEGNPLASVPPGWIWFKDAKKGQ